MTISSLLRCRIDFLITQIDRELNRQINEILHHPRLQALEASWRGLYLLVSQTQSASDVKIRILDASWAQLAHDAENACDFDQSRLFDMVYSQEFGMPGGEPFGLLLGDYFFSGTSGTNDGGYNIVTTLSSVTNIAAAAFCPFIAGAGAGMVGLEDYAELSRIADLQSLMRNAASERWKRWRLNEDTRFIGLVAPRILMRASYEPDLRERHDGFAFREYLDEAGKNLLWGNGAYAFALVIIRNFIETGWFADLRGLNSEENYGGQLSAEELPSYDLKYESAGLSAQPPIEVRFTTAQEQKLCELGIIPIVSSYMSDTVLFNSNQSLHMTNHYQNHDAQENAQLSAMLQYVLCVSRFAHYIKIIIRQTVGQNTDPATIEKHLQDWLLDYTADSSDSNAYQRARHPLRSATISVREVIGSPGTLISTIELQPHFQLDNISVNFQLIAEPLKTGQSVRGRAEAYA